MVHFDDKTFCTTVALLALLARGEKAQAAQGSQNREAIFMVYGVGVKQCTAKDREEKESVQLVCGFVTWFSAGYY